ncbi:MAG: type II secretion system major pseudopilin GspG [Congregibacter sp.]|nr:type II secretion system major pseudopilin GspG [Congregibacter sp.]MDP5071011.1 type II secretion system major pseudopilin GspG [Congregibacter sp.]
MRRNISRRDQDGFSLVEILVVLVIMGLLISIVAPTVLNRADDARIQKAQADFKAIETALKIYRLDNYVYPNTEQGLEALVSPSSLDPVPRNFKSGGYLAELPLDPWGRPYLYLSPGENAEVDIYSLGADGLAGGEDQNADIGNWKEDRD